jgi:hypothetical protein
MRIELGFDDKGIELIEELKLLTGIKTNKELFNNSITLFDWAVVQTIQGRLVTSLDEQEKNYKQLVMPSLQYAGRLSDDAKAQVLSKRHIVSTPTSTRKDFEAAKVGS